MGLYWGVQMITDVIHVSLAVVAPTLMTLYGISPGTMGIVLSGWQWTYVGFLPLAGPIVDRFGTWMVLGVGSGIWGVATLALPLAGGSAVALFLVRALYGFGHCVRFPAQAWSLVRWFKPNERAMAVGVCFSGGQESMTEVLSEPAEARISWSSLWRYRSVWGIIFGQLGYLYTYFFFMTWWPSYLIMERGLTLATLTMVATAFAPETWMSVTLLTLCMGCMRLITASANSAPMDLAPPTVVGSLTSIQNSIGTISSLLVSILTGYIVEVTGTFVPALVLAGGGGPDGSHQLCGGGGEF